jgi:hypothetical protein
MTTPENPETRLPVPLRSSKLPWRPCNPEQAAAMRPGDSWRADLGPLALSVDLAPPGFENGPPSHYDLWLWSDGEPLASWSYPRLDLACAAAEAVADSLLAVLDAQIGRAACPVTRVSPRGDSPPPRSPRP